MTAPGRTLRQNSAQAIIKTREELALIAGISHNTLKKIEKINEKRTYLIGKQYEHRKNRHGGDRKSEEAKSKGQNVPLIPTYKQIAIENNISSKSVQRAEQYAKAVDNVAKNLGNETKDKILSGELKTSKKDIIELSKLEPEKQARRYW